MRCARAMSRPPRADARSAWSSRPRRGLRLLLPQSRQPPARDVLEALAELLLRLNQRRARQDEHGVLLFHAGRDLNVVLIGQARLDRHRGDVAGAAHEHDIAVSRSSPRASRAPPAPPPPPPPPPPRTPPPAHNLRGPRPLRQGGGRAPAPLWPPPPHPRA